MLHKVRHHAGRQDLRRVVGVNGIASNGHDSTDRVLRRCEDLGLCTVDVELPRRYSISARWGGRHDGALVASVSRPGDILVCHSYGAVRAWHAHKHVEYAAIVCIAPAMGMHVQWRHPQRVTCFYSPADWIVRIGAWLPLSPFGRAGINGFSQPGIRNYEFDSSHNGYFERPELLDRIVAQIEVLAGLHRA